MFQLIMQLFVVLLTFIGSLATIYLSLNNKPYMRSALIDFNPVELNYYLSMVSPDKYD